MADKVSGILARIGSYTGDGGTAANDSVKAEMDLVKANVDKIPMSDGTVTWNATAAATIKTQAASALTDYDPPTKAEVDAVVESFRAIMPSNTLRHSIDTEESGQNIDYVEVKSFKCGLVGWYRVKFDIASNGDSHTAHGRIYKDGIAFGTEQSQYGTTYATKSEDLYIPAGSLISLYVKVDSAAYYWKVKNFRLYGDYASAFTTVLT